MNYYNKYITSLLPLRKAGNLISYNCACLYLIIGRIALKNKLNYGNKISAEAVKK